MALDRALKLAPRFGGDREQRHWANTWRQLRAQILERGYDEEQETFVGAYGHDHVDATLLLVPLYGFLPPSDPRVHRTLDRVVKELGSGRFLHRYRSTDGIDADEGAFVLCGFWLAEALALSGRLDEALGPGHCGAGG